VSGGESGGESGLAGGGEAGGGESGGESSGESGLIEGRKRVCCTERVHLSVTAAMAVLPARSPFEAHFRPNARASVTPGEVVTEGDRTVVCT